MPRPDRLGPKPQHTHPGVLHAFVLAVVLSIALLIAGAPASAYSGWKHSTAGSEGSCAAGCHAAAAPTNVTCTRCHKSFTARGTQKCWDCHKPGQATSTWQLTAGCTATCHISTRPTGRPTYITPYTHAPTVHNGAAGYGKTCVQCHGVAAGPTAPGKSRHHDAADSPAPTCAGCHDGGIAAAPAGHAVYGANCASCHSGMKRPSSSCSSCHVGRTGTSAPQITYANTLACADAGCHGKVLNHGATPIAAAPCSSCHAPHYQALGGCQTCHPDPQSFHHRSAAARPLADCAGCHDGGIAADRTTHGTLACSACHTDMGRPAVPAVCSQCHPATGFGTATCTACHSATGMMGREQIHAETPKAGVACTTCHAGHNADLGTCQTCHGMVPEAHHGVVAPSTSALRVEVSPLSLAAGGSAVVRGTLQDAAGTALAGVEVLLQSRPFSQTAFTDVAPLTTDADGSFSQPVRPAVRYGVSRRLQGRRFGVLRAAPCDRLRLDRREADRATRSPADERASRRKGQALRRGRADGAATRRYRFGGDPARRAQVSFRLAQGRGTHGGSTGGRHVLVVLATAQGRRVSSTGRGAAVA